jgi:hypothetical protein
MMNKRYLTAFLTLFALLASIPPTAFPSNAHPFQTDDGVSENVILRWNRVLVQTVGIPGQHPSHIVAARSFAMMHGAMFDAVNSIDGSYEPYLIEVPGTKNASIDAAAAQAAYDVLVALFPGRAADFGAELDASLAGIPENRIRQGLRVGSQAAHAMLMDRANDGWNAERPAYVLPPDPGNWQPTGAPAAFTHYPAVKPFVLENGLQFNPVAPPALSSAEYAAAFNEVKALGSATSSTRTADQTQSALSWASIGTPTGVAVIWNNVARSIATTRGTTTVENARLFALLNMSHHDAFQTSFASKFHHGLWRPITAIRRAEEDGNPETAPDPNWASLIGNPPYPTYAGNMATIGMANAGILSRFFGRDDIPVEYSFTYGGNTVIRRWASLSAMAEDGSRSREYGGIHFRFDSVAGESIGLNTSNYLFAHAMTPKCR